MMERTVRHVIWMMVAVVSVGVMDSTCHGQVEAVTRARYDLKLGFTVGGKVQHLAVKPGDRVKKGQLLMELEDEEGKSLVALYTIRASSDLEMRSAEAALRLAKVEEKAIRKAFENDAAKPIEVERAQIRTTQAQLELRMTAQRGLETQQQLAQAKTRHQQYVMRAPTSGVVDLISVEHGEMVEALKPILRLVTIDPLWVDAAVPTDQTLRLKRGDTAWVRSNLLGHEQTVAGKIIHLAEVADAASDTRLVRVEVPNPQLLPAGGPVSVSFEPPSPGSSTAAEHVGASTLVAEAR